MCQCAGGSYCRAIARPGGSSSGFPSFHCCFPAQGIKNCPCTELSSVQGQEKILWCHLACRGIPRPLCGKPTLPCPVTGAADCGYCGHAVSPRPLRTICLRRFPPLSQQRGLSVGAPAVLLSLHRFSLLYHSTPALSSSFFRQVSAFLFTRPAPGPGFAPLRPRLPRRP